MGIVGFLLVQILLAIDASRLLQSLHGLGHIRKGGLTMQENYELIQKGFRLLLPHLAGYIGQEMSRVYRDDWWQEVLTALSDQYDLPSKGEYGELLDSLDIANCLRLIDRRWRDVFSQKMSKSHRNWASELMGVRNDVLEALGCYLNSNNFSPESWVI